MPTISYTSASLYRPTDIVGWAREAAPSGTLTPERAVSRIWGLLRGSRSAGEFPLFGVKQTLTWHLPSAHPPNFTRPKIGPRSERQTILRGYHYSLSDCPPLLIEERRDDQDRLSDTVGAYLAERGSAGRGSGSISLNRFNESEKS